MPWRIRIVRRRPRRTAVQRATYLSQREGARTLVLSRLAHFNQVYGFTFGTVSIRDQRSRWGSCSSKGNLNFNYRIALLPAHLADYIVVHELCHRGEFNHSQRFWDLVAQVMPDYARLREELRKIPLR
jgi:hypothetical protein